jgi:hypothetical protein
LYVLVAVLFLSSAALSGWFLSVAREAVGATKTTPLTQAWLVGPLVHSGVAYSTDVVLVDVRTNETRQIKWFASSGDVEIAHGSFLLPATETHEIAIPAQRAKANTFMRVRVSGTSSDLQLFVRSNRNLDGDK